MKFEDDDLKKIIEIEDSILEKLGSCEKVDSGYEGLNDEERKKLAALSSSKELYSTVIQSILGIKLTEETARNDWNNILVHKYFLSQKVGHDVGIILAVLDYYKNIKKEDREFRLIDRKTLESTYQNLITDSLTGLYNHRYFHEQLQRFIQSHSKTSSTLSLFFFDIDDFKNFNDTNGHLAGDILLAEIARIIYENIRMDFDLPCRYGGEEFAIIMPYTDKKNALQLAERTRENIASYSFPGREYQPLKIVSISGGISEFPSEANNRKDLINLADKRLYRAKKKGKNRIVT
ncbi:MAG: DUF4032 domain-containing protein [Candidatus Hydrogenedentota bacterium]